MSRFNGKIGVVTGGNRGIGAAMVRRLLQEGATILAASTSGKAPDIAAEHKDRLHVMACDVTDRTQVKALFDECHQRFGRLDLLCNNAGIGQSAGRIHELDTAIWDRVMDVNLKGAFLVLHSALPLLLQSGGGAVVNTASISSIKPNAGTGAYPVSKAALLMLTRTTALEYAQQNIRVNAIGPGTVNTEMVANADPAHIARILSMTPMGRAASVEEVAALTAFLLSDEAGFTTGAYYPMSGGREAS